MFVTKKHLSRRTVLRGLGATVALPLLDAMIPAHTALAHTAGDRAGEQIGLDQHLKPVADPDHRLARGDEVVEGVAKVMRDLIGEDLPRRNVIPITEPPRDRQKLKLLHLSRILQQPVHMQKRAARPRQFKGVGGFGVAVRTGGAKDQSAGLHDGVQQ